MRFPLLSWNHPRVLDDENRMIPLYRRERTTSQQRLAAFIPLIAFLLGASATHKQTPLHTPAPMQPPLVAPYYASADCNTSDALTLIASDDLLKRAPRHAALLLQQRIAACNEIIKAYLASLPPVPPSIAKNPPGMPALPSPTANPTAPPGCTTRKPGSGALSYDALRLYSALTYCVTWITLNVPSAAPSVATPPPITLHTPLPGASGQWTKYVYVFALTSDPPTSAQIALQIAGILRSPRLHPRVATPAPSVVVNPTNAYTGRDVFTGRHVEYVILATPTMTLEQFQQQCFADPSTAGAIVAVQPGTQSSSFNLLWNTSWTTLGLQAMVVDCEPTNTAYIHNAAHIVSVSHVRYGSGKRYSFSLATALGLLSGILALHPARSSSYTVVPPSPLPPPGQSYQTGYTVGTNQGIFTAAAVGVAALTPVSSTNLGQASTSDSQTAGAIAAIAPYLIDDLMRPCDYEKPDRDYVPNTTIPLPQCQWFSYRPPRKGPE